MKIKMNKQQRKMFMYGSLFLISAVFFVSFAMPMAQMMTDRVPVTQSPVVEITLFTGGQVEAGRTYTLEISVYDDDGDIENVSVIYQHGENITILYDKPARNPAQFIDVVSFTTNAEVGDHLIAALAFDSATNTGGDGEFLYNIPEPYVEGEDGQNNGDSGSASGFELLLVILAICIIKWRRKAE